MLHGDITEAYDALEALLASRKDETPEIYVDSEVWKELEQAKNHLFTARILTDEQYQS